ncbi:MAG: hypothetical protein WD602_10485 [Actinomycetota bacterium]
MTIAQVDGSRPTRLARRKAVGITFVLMGILAACSESGSSLPSLSNTETVTSEDGGLQMRIPNSWQARKDLNPSAAMQAGNRESDAYTLVVVDPREFFGNLSLGKFADIEIQQFIDTVGDPTVSGPELVIVDDREALQYEVRGVVDEQNVVYLYTFAETPDRFLKIVTWSIGSRFEENLDDMQMVTESVHQLEPLGDVEPSPLESADIPTDPTPVPSIDRGDQD